MFSPTDDGGIFDLSFSEAAAVFEELGRGDAALAFSISMHNAVASAVTRFGDDVLRTRWAQPLGARRGALGGFWLTEPQAGSDAAASTTKATQGANGDWTVTGRKAWVSLGGEADVFLVVAKTADEAGAPRRRDDRGRGGGAPGVSFTEPYHKASAA